MTQINEIKSTNINSLKSSQLINQFMIIGNNQYKQLAQHEFKIPP